MQIETKVSAEQSGPAACGNIKKKKSLARSKDKIQRLLTAWGFTWLQEKPPQCAAKEISLYPDQNGLCFSRNLRSIEREGERETSAEPVQS